jgi:hypothetical protein
MVVKITVVDLLLTRSPSVAIALFGSIRFVEEDSDRR